MNPPISVNVRTDNQHKVFLTIKGEGSDPVTLEVASGGNVYSGLHSIRESLERVINDILGFHGIVPPPPPSERPDELALRAAAAQDLRTQVEQLAAQKAVLDEHDALQAQKAALEAEIAQRTTPAPETVPDVVVPTPASPSVEPK